MYRLKLAILSDVLAAVVSKILNSRMEICSGSSTEWLFVHWNLDRIGIWKCRFLRRGENRSTRTKPIGAEKRTNNKLNPHMASRPEIDPEPHRWEASAPTTAPSLLTALHELKRRTKRKEILWTKKPNYLIRGWKEGLRAAKRPTSVFQTCCFRFNIILASPNTLYNNKSRDTTSFPESWPWERGCPVMHFKLLPVAWTTWSRDQNYDYHVWKELKKFFVEMARGRNRGLLTSFEN